jgi:hypothetical protein
LLFFHQLSGESWSEASLDRLIKRLIKAIQKVDEQRLLENLSEIADDIQRILLQQQAKNN